MKTDAPLARQTSWLLGRRICGSFSSFLAHTYCLSRLHLTYSQKCVSRSGHGTGNSPSREQRELASPTPTIPDPGRAFTDEGRNSSQARRTGIFCILPPCTDLPRGDSFFGACHTQSSSACLGHTWGLTHPDAQGLYFPA